MELLHFNGPVWRAPFEATSQLLQVTAGCSHHRCKFCSLYGTQKFRMSAMEEITDRDLLIHELLTAKAALSEDHLEQYRKIIKSL